MFIVVLVVLVGISSCTITDTYGHSKHDSPVYKKIISSKNVGEFVETYFPLRTGNNWTYKVKETIDFERDKGSFDLSDTNITFRISIDTLSNISNYNSSFKKTLQGFKIMNRSDWSSFYVKHDSCISLLNFESNNINGYILIYDYKTYGKEYKGCRYLGDKEVTVPAGTFNTKVFAVKYYKKRNQTIYYFAKDVGWVMFETYGYNGEKLSSYELIEYNLVDD